MPVSNTLSKHLTARILKRVPVVGRRSATTSGLDAKASAYRLYTFERVVGDWSRDAAGTIERAQTSTRARST